MGIKLQISKRSCFFFLFLALSYYGFYVLYKKEIKRNRKLKKQHSEYLTLVEKKLAKHGCTFGGVLLPDELNEVPFADDLGIVLGVKNLSVRGVLAPYNASILKQNEGYRLFFRFDKLVSKSLFPYHTYIGCCQLDKNFEQTDREFQIVDLKSHTAEDPRAIEVNNKTYLVYNDLLPYRENPKAKPSVRTMHVAELTEDLTTNQITSLDLQLKWVEKNWVPFEYTEEKNQKKLYFEYKRSPHKILRLGDPKDSKLSHLSFSDKSFYKKLPWPKKWGEVRGGTPALKIGDQYLAFFHSAFEDEEEFVWYIMGAYTFEAKPPFKITSISEYPVLFKGVFSSPRLNIARPHVRCLYPSGFVCEKINGREVFIVSCGENDSAIKLVTFDKEKLLKSLISIN